MIKFCPNDGSMLAGEGLGFGAGVGRGSWGCRGAASGVPRSTAASRRRARRPRPPNSSVAPDRGPEGDGGLHFYCASCPYAFPIVAELTSAAAVRARVEAAVVSGDGGWEQAQKSDDGARGAKEFWVGWGGGAASGAG